MTRIGSEEKILETKDEDSGVVIVTEKKEVRITWAAAFILHELGYQPMTRKEMYKSLPFSECQIDYGIEQLLRLSLAKKDRDKYTLTAAGKNVWSVL